MVGVLDTNDNFALDSATAALDQAEIVYDVERIPDVPENLKGANPKWFVPPSRILVSAEDEADARALVEPFQFPVERSGLEATLDPNQVSGTSENAPESGGRLITLHRILAILGLPLGTRVVASVLSDSGMISGDSIEAVIRVSGVCCCVAIAAIGLGVIVDAIRK